jgi:hypothetical protein
MTKKILLVDAIKFHKLKMVEKYGSEWNYKKVWCKEHGFNTPNDYRKFLAEINGFESYWKMFVSNSGKTVKEILENQAKNKGFKNFKEYQDFIAKRSGFKNFQKYKQEWAKVKSKENFLNGMCSKCGKERENKSFNQCNKCRIKGRENDKRLRDRRRDKGLCIYCGKFKAKNGYSKCESCRKINLKITKRYRKELSQIQSKTEDKNVI